MIDLKSIHPLTDFKRNTSKHLKELKSSRSPLVLTVNGKAEIVVLDAETYQDLLNKIEYAENVKAIQEGIQSFEKGEGTTAKKAFAELAEKYDIQS